MSKVYNLTDDDGNEVTLVVGEDDVTVRIGTIGEITVDCSKFVGVFPEINSMTKFRTYEIIDTEQRLKKMTLASH